MAGVRVRIQKDGKVLIEWDGFQGETCYVEAQKLYQLLKSRGVDVEVREIKPVLTAGRETKVAVADKQLEMGGW